MKSAPKFKTRSDAARMVGRRFGSVKVLALTGRDRYPCGQSQLRYRVRCDCGRTWTAQGTRLRQGHGCIRCRQAEVGLKSSIRLPDGVTIAQIAHATGLRLDTVYHRWIRGWPRYRLGEVTRSHQETP